MNTYKTILALTALVVYTQITATESLNHKLHAAVDNITNTMHDKLVATRRALAKPTPHIAGRTPANALRIQHDRALKTAQNARVAADDLEQAVQSELRQARADLDGSQLRYARAQKDKQELAVLKTEIRELEKHLLV